MPLSAVLRAQPEEVAMHRLQYPPHPRAPRPPSPPPTQLPPAEEATNLIWHNDLRKCRARGGGFEPPSSFEHWMFAPFQQKGDSNPAPCRAGPSPLDLRIMPSAVLKVCRFSKRVLAHE